tara:strand:+ start:3465 stop:3929 length:465 start_codon:yes stop_codon:yes gene_type:complete
MKKLLFALCIAFLGNTVSTQAQSDVKPVIEEVDPNGPVITFDSLIVDFGTINKGDDPYRTVQFTNTGKKALHITNCKGSCGCTVPKCPTTPIMPGEKGDLKVRYDTKRVGNINKTVTVKSNATNGTLYLKVKGKILDVKTEPAMPVNNSIPNAQ